MDPQSILRRCWKVSCRCLLTKGSTIGRFPGISHFDHISLCQVGISIYGCMCCNFIKPNVSYLQTVSKLQDSSISFIQMHAILIKMYVKGVPWSLVTCTLVASFLECQKAMFPHSHIFFSLFKGSSAKLDFFFFFRQKAMAFFKLLNLT